MKQTIFTFFCLLVMFFGSSALAGQIKVEGLGWENNLSDAVYLNKGDRFSYKISCDLDVEFKELSSASNDQAWGYFSFGGLRFPIRNNSLSERRISGEFTLDRQLRSYDLRFYFLDPEYVDRIAFIDKRNFCSIVVNY